MKITLLLKLSLNVQNDSFGTVRTNYRVYHLIGGQLGDDENKVVIGLFGKSKVIIYKVMHGTGREQF